MADASPLYSGSLGYPLPRWMDLHYEADAVLARFFQAVGEFLTEAGQESADRQAGIWLASAPLGSPRASWQAGVALAPASRVSLALRLDGNPVPARRARSPHDFWTTSDCVWTLEDPDSPWILRVRNLERVEETLTPTAGASGIYTITLSETPLPDSDVLWTPAGEATSGQVWHRIPAGSAVATGTTLAIWASGDVTVVYNAAARRALPGEYQIDGGSWYPLGPVDLPNVLDAHGALLDCPRFPEEDNQAYQTRLLQVLGVPAGPALQGVKIGLGRALGLTTLQTWDGSDVLTLPAATTQVTVQGVPRRARHEEVLRPSRDRRRFYSSWTDWDPGYEVRIDGIEVTRRGDPGMTYVASGSALEFTDPVSGQVSATFQAARYTLTSASGYYTEVVPVTGNLPIGRYTVISVQSLEARTLSDPDYRTGQLLLASGMPTSLLLALAETLRSTVPFGLGQSRWGAPWFEAGEPAPHTLRLPVPWDRDDPESPA